jgi:hypothetical protein
MTKTEARLRAALLKCHAQLCLHQRALNSPDVDEAVGLASDALFDQAHEHMAPEQIAAAGNNPAPQKPRAYHEMPFPRLPGKPPADGK